MPPGAVHPVSRPSRSDTRPTAPALMVCSSGQSPWQCSSNPMAVKHWRRGLVIRLIRLVPLRFLKWRHRRRRWSWRRDHVWHLRLPWNTHMPRSLFGSGHCPAPRANRFLTAWPVRAPARAVLTPRTVNSRAIASIVISAACSSRTSGPTRDANRSALTMHAALAWAAGSVGSYRSQPSISLSATIRVTASSIDLTATRHPSHRRPTPSAMRATRNSLDTRATVQEARAGLNPT